MKTEVETGVERGFIVNRLRLPGEVPELIEESHLKQPVVVEGQHTTVGLRERVLPGFDCEYRIEQPPVPAQTCISCLRFLRHEHCRRGDFRVIDLIIGLPPPFVICSASSICSLPRHVCN